MINVITLGSGHSQTVTVRSCHGDPSIAVLNANSNIPGSAILTQRDLLPSGQYNYRINFPSAIISPTSLTVELLNETSGSPIYSSIIRDVDQYGFDIEFSNILGAGYSLMSTYISGNTNISSSHVHNNNIYNSYISGGEETNGVTSINGLTGVLSFSGINSVSVSTGNNIIIISGDTGIYNSFVTKSDTGNFLVSSITGQFYPFSNPSSFISNSGFLTGFNSGLFASTIDLESTGSFLYSLVSNLNNWTGISPLLFYPRTSNPSGFVTGLVVRPTETGFFITTSQTGVFATSSNLAQSGQTLITLIQGVNTGVSSLNGLSGVIILTGGGNVSVIQNGNTFTISGNTGAYSQFITTAQTGAFYPNTNPSGFITGVNTGNFITNNQTGIFATSASLNQTGSNLLSLINSLNSWTGNTINLFYPLSSNPSGFVTGSVVRPTQTGIFLTTGQTGGFYPSYNPSGFVGEASLSSVVRTTGNQNISGDKNFIFNNYFSIGRSGSGAGLMEFSSDNDFIFRNTNGTLLFVSNNPTFLDTNETISVAIDERSLFDSSANFSVGWNTRQLFDSFSSVAVDWSSRFLINGLANRYLNWQSGIISGDWEIYNTPIHSGDIINKGYLDSVVSSLGSGSGSSAVVHKFFVELDFGFSGSGEGDIATISITGASGNWVTSTTSISCIPIGATTINHDPDDVYLERILAYPCNIIPNTGFDIVATSQNGTFGIYKISVICQD